MFEKEAEEYIKANNLEWELECHRTSPIGEVEQAFQKGAEFGYNKAKEEMQEQGLALQSDMDKTIEQNIQLKKQIEKMKCCHNCKKFHNLSYDCTCAEVCNEWEIKEND